jgi:hypothetical protein
MSYLFRFRRVINESRKVQHARVARAPSPAQQTSPLRKREWLVERPSVGIVGANTFTRLSSESVNARDGSFNGGKQGRNPTMGQVGHRGSAKPRKWGRSLVNPGGGRITQSVTRSPTSQFGYSRLVSAFTPAGRLTHMRATGSPGTQNLRRIVSNRFLKDIAVPEGGYCWGDDIGTSLTSTSKSRDFVQSCIGG